MIVPSDIPSVDEGMARRIIAIARSIAPCLDSLVDGAGDKDPKPLSDAIAILTGIAREGVARGSRLVKSQRIATAAVEYTVDGSWFSVDDRAALKSLCGVAAVAGLPVGRFPRAGVVTGMWPEEQD